MKITQEMLGAIRRQAYDYIQRELADYCKRINEHIESGVPDDIEGPDCDFCWYEDLLGVSIPYENTVEIIFENTDGVIERVMVPFEDVFDAQ